jgi:hypothetical protein
VTDRRIRKRDGTLATFDDRKLERSILNAAHGAGQDNPQLARDLASVVSTYLREHFGAGVATSQDLKSMVHKVLVDTGYPEVARSYLEFAKARPGPHGDLFPQDLVVIDGSTRDEVERWDKERIRAALQADGIAAPDAASIADAVEARILALQSPHVSTSLVRELVGLELAQRSIRTPVPHHRILGIPKADLQELLAHPRGLDPDGLCLQLGQSMLKQYALQELFARDVAEAHLRGSIHIHGLENPFKFYWARIPWSSLSGSSFRYDLARRHVAQALELGAAPPGDVAWEHPQAVVDSSDPSGDVVRCNVMLPRSGNCPPGVVARALQRGQTLFSFEPGSRFGPEETILIGQAVSINLPQIARRSPKLFDELEATVEIAVRAHIQKRHVLASFLQDLSSGLRQAMPALRFSVGLQGLQELVRWTTGKDLGADDETVRFGQQVLSFAAGLVREASLRHQARIALEDLYSTAAVERFARIDARLHPSGPGARAAYTAGHHPATGDWSRRLSVEARLGSIVGASAVWIPRGSRPEFSSESMAALLSRAAADLRIGRVLVV